MWAFEAYAALPERSIPKLHLALAALEEDDFDLPTERTLGEWSRRFNWPDRVQMHDIELARRLTEAMLPLHVQRAAKTLTMLDKLKEKFYASIEAGDVEVDLDKFERILRMEQMVLPKQVNGAPGNSPASVVNVGNLTVRPDQLETLLDDVIERRHGLPTMKDVSPK
jgi:hypothetical protein